MVFAEGRESQSLAAPFVAQGLIAELSYPETLWARRGKSGGLVWLEHKNHLGVCVILAQSERADMDFPVPCPEFDWEETNLDGLCREAARSGGGIAKGKGILPCVGVLIDFERVVYVR